MENNEKKKCTSLDNKKTREVECCQFTEMTVGNLTSKLKKDLPYFNKYKS